MCSFALSSIFFLHLFPLLLVRGFYLVLWFLVDFRGSIRVYRQLVAAALNTYCPVSEYVSRFLELPDVAMFFEGRSVEVDGLASVLAGAVQGLVCHGLFFGLLVLSGRGVRCVLLWFR